MAINNFNVGVGTTSQLTRYRYVATGGETSVSGTDADGKTLSYTVGLEQVFLNGVNLVRGQDYTATNGTSVGSLTALVASDVVEVFAYVPFNIANALTVSTVDAKGDLLVGTGADAVGRLAVGTNGQLLSAASGETSGLKWANPGLTLIKTQSFSAVASSSVDDVFSATYDNYRFILDITDLTSDAIVYMKLRVSATDNSTNYYTMLNGITSTAGAFTEANNAVTTGLFLTSGDAGTDNIYGYTGDLLKPFLAVNTKVVGISHSSTTLGTPASISGAGLHFVATSYTGINLIASAGNMTGSIKIYGYNN
jgi:hypothetical protein